jgi:hypothetical protein
MSRQYRRTTLPLLGALLFCLLVGVYLLACKRFAKADPSPPVVKHQVKTSPADALKYWTGDKMRKAKAARLPHIDARQREEHPPHPSDPHQT